MECNVISAVFGLIVTTILIGFCAEFLVDSIDGIATSWKISHGFIGLIILPIVGNAAEHVSALFAALRNKMDLAIGVSLGSSLQIAIFVTPVLVLVGWIIGQPLTLDFPVFDISVIFATVLIVINLINDGNSNWLEGFILLMSYFIIGFAFYLLPDPASALLQ